MNRLSVFVTLLIVTHGGLASIEACGSELDDVLAKLAKRRDTINAIEISIDATRTILKGSSNWVIDQSHPDQRKGVDMPDHDMPLRLKRQYRVDCKQGWWFDSKQGKDLYHEDKFPFLVVKHEQEESYYDGTRYVVVTPERKNRPVGVEGGDRVWFNDVEIVTPEGGAGSRTISAVEYIVLFSAGRMPLHPAPLMLSDIEAEVPYPRLSLKGKAAIDGDECVVAMSHPMAGRTFYSEYWLDLSGKIRRFRQLHGAVPFLHLDLKYADSDPLGLPRPARTLRSLG